MAKNKDTKTVNRTGSFEMETMTITHEDKNGIQVFDLKSLLKEFDGGNVSITIGSDFDPSHIVED
ncbi:YonK family protein [Paenibacillus sp. XY044]|uniref:YonK family protein n=1 Tax=Paenibacillus sp. XY044 TaxID=2026089 RepID=UPI000B98D0AA|nr:YonK family protein [Paenibacillus sp. XY044]OZB98035.1 hypothetical protein CJP46_02390 [Paenibacillus sp. XY044]